MKVVKDENKSAIDRLVASNERFANTITMRVIGAIGLLGVFIAILHFYK